MTKTQQQPTQKRPIPFALPAERVLCGTGLRGRRGEFLRRTSSSLQKGVELSSSDSCCFSISSAGFWWGVFWCCLFFPMFKGETWTIMLCKCLNLSPGGTEGTY